MAPIDEYLSALEELSRLREENRTLQQRIKDLEAENMRYEAQIIKSAEEIGRLTSGAEGSKPEAGGSQEKTIDKRFDHVMYKRGRPPVSDAVKKEVLALRAGGYSIRRIAADVGLSYGACQKIIKDHKRE